MAKGQTRRSAAKQTPDAEELLAEELKEIHSAESQLARVLPRLEKAVESDRLRACIQTRAEQGERLLKGVEEALDELDESPGRKKNVAAEGLINDAREHVQETAGGAALDSLLIAGLQKTEHYCIAAWGTVKSMANALGHKKIARTMELALKEGGDLDEELTRVAEEEVTPALLAAGEGEGGGSGRRQERHATA